ncbi:carbohydrate ABC transporter permease [uncultured Robinsoniella sp.]|uniref:carbohydrate ABC transporter permease n=1 Tax=uncultured Robinsoniella sp. TaxID=904190 RepID=UPI00374FCB17
MKKKRIGKKGWIVPYLYLVPATVIMVVMLGFPIIYNIGVSFFDWTLMSKEKTFHGFANYIKIFSDEKFVKILMVTLVWTLLGIVLQMVIGIAMALIVDKMNIGKKFMRTSMLIPWIIPGVVTALMWKWMLQADVGIINNLLMSLKLTDKSILFLSDTHLALITLVLINAWKATPFWFLMITAGLQSKPVDQIEAATVDGARYPHILKYVILPHLSPVISSTGILTTIWTLNYFDLIWTTTKGGPLDATSTLPVYTYRLAFEFNDFGRSAAMAVISLIIVSIACIPYIRKMFQNLKYEGVL